MSTSMFPSISSEDLPTGQELIMLLISLIVPFVFALYGLLVHLTPEHEPPVRSSLSYTSPTSSTPQPLPPPLSSPSPPPQRALSIIVPAYNEALRLPAMLGELHAWLTSSERTREQAFGAVGEEISGWEVIVVDDGSSDETEEAALKVGREWEKGPWGKGRIGKGELRVVKLGKNQGKGGAVRHGVLHSRGARVLFADADGASTFSSLEQLQKDLDEVEVDFPTSSTDSPSRSSAESKPEQVKDGLRKRATGKTNGSATKSGSSSPKPTLGLSIGSRAHLVSTDLVVKRSFLRNLLMHGFHVFVKTLGVRDVRDTQCGFKLFTRPTAALLFPPMQLSRWSFDVELLVLADMCRLAAAPPSSPTSDPNAPLPVPSKSIPFKIPVAETPIQWHEVAGSKISLTWDSIGMARDLVVLRICLGVGRWVAPVLLVEEEKDKSS
ncbi:nucleotide-diphospho-sugar transferase [Mrakia frigida]|uniref:dolichyl-phosphate beta-glucosyltransferase n=1 Tax=Mrakia frigida TaxID=29902 RepID=UPI003FCC03B8